jgi:hypothetical protein
MKTKTLSVLLVAMFGAAGPLVAQETPKPVPKGSVRVYLPGCAKGYVFTVGSRTLDETASRDVPEGTHLRMNGPKSLIAEIQAHQSSIIEITGVMKTGQFRDGITVGGVHIGPGPGPASGGSFPANPMAGQVLIDVEGWRPLSGTCPSR